MSRVPLLDVAPGLAAHLCHEELREARSRCLVSVVGLARGKGVATLAAPAEGGFLVIRGMLTRRLLVGDRSGAELLGSGDVIYPTPSRARGGWSRRRSSPRSTRAFTAARHRGRGS